MKVFFEKNVQFAFVVSIEAAETNASARSVEDVLVVATDRDGQLCLTPMPCMRDKSYGNQVDFRRAVTAMKAVAESLVEEGEIFRKEGLPPWNRVTLSPWVEKWVAKATHNSPFPGVVVEVDPEEEIYVNCNRRVWPRQTLVGAERCLNLPSEQYRSEWENRHYTAIAVSVKKIHPRLSEKDSRECSPSKKIRRAPG